MTEVGFYHLTRQPIDVVLPRLVEKAYEAGHRIAIRSTNADLLKRVDDALWTFDERSFLAHGRAPDGEQPIELTEGEASNGADVLVALDHGLPEDATSFARVLYLFEEADGEALTAARAAWAALKTRDDLTRTYWQQTERGGWTKAA